MWWYKTRSSSFVLAKSFVLLLLRCSVCASAFIGLWLIREVSKHLSVCFYRLYRFVDRTLVWKCFYLVETENQVLRDGERGSMSSAGRREHLKNARRFAGRSNIDGHGIAQFPHLKSAQWRYLSHWILNRFWILRFALSLDPSTCGWGLSVNLYSH